MTYDNAVELQARLKRCLIDAGPTVADIDELAKKLTEEVEQFLDDYDYGYGWDSSDC